jgi:osmotically-inducible protein OsmY
MKSDLQIQKDVMEELKWDPLLQASEIGVSVKNGIVTLSGQVDSYSKKLAAERNARRISGVKAIAEDIQIGVSPVFRKTDAEIAAAVVDALKWHSCVQEEKVKIKVEDGHVRLDGEVDWDYQRTSAKSAIENLAGVKSVLNLIRIKPGASLQDVKVKISAALHRAATVDASRIRVDVTGSKVILHGNVRSFAEKQDAETAAWNAPGVTSVESHLNIEEPAFAFED